MMPTARTDTLTLAPTYRDGDPTPSPTTASPSMQPTQNPSVEPSSSATTAPTIGPIAGNEYEVVVKFCFS